MIAPQLDSLDCRSLSACKMGFLTVVKSRIRECNGHMSLAYGSSRLANAGRAGLGEAGSAGADRAARDRCTTQVAEVH